MHRERAEAWIPVVFSPEKPYRYVPSRERYGNDIFQGKADSFGIPHAGGTHNALFSVTTGPMVGQLVALARRISPRGSPRVKVFIMNPITASTVLAENSFRLVPDFSRRPGKLWITTGIEACYV